MIKGRSSFTSSSRVKDVANRLNLEKKSNEDSPALVHWTLVLVTRIVSQVIVSTSAGYFLERRWKIAGPAGDSR